MNRIELEGNLVAPAEIGTDGNGKPWSALRLATNDGGTAFHRIVVFGEVGVKYMAQGKKGQRLYVKGSLRPREGNINGKKVTSFSVHADQMLWK